jgi:hypothetical protein
MVSMLVSGVRGRAAAWRSAGLRLLVAGAAWGASAWPAAAVPAVGERSPLAVLEGRWVGEGRLGVKGNATEQVKCRATYAFLKDADQLKQSIRCASAGGNVEVQSVVTHADGKLTGTWKELVREMNGNLTGAVTPRGFKVNVRGESLNANMDIIVIGAKQVIEIQFIDSSLIGLTLVLEQG